jgi:hypothetical protein
VITPTLSPEYNEYQKNGQKNPSKNIWIPSFVIALFFGSFEIQMG